MDAIAIEIERRAITVDGCRNEFAVLVRRPEMRHVRAAILGSGTRQSPAAGESQTMEVGSVRSECADAAIAVRDHV